MFDQQMKHLLDRVGQWASEMPMHSSHWWVPAVLAAFAIGFAARVYLWLAFKRGQRFVLEFRQRVESGGGSKDKSVGFAAALEQVLDGTLRATFPPSANGKKMRVFRTQAALNRLIDETLKRVSTIETSSSLDLRERVAEVFKSNPEFGPRVALEMVAEALPRFFLVSGLFGAFVIALGAAGHSIPGSSEERRRTACGTRRFEQPWSIAWALHFSSGPLPRHGSVQAPSFLPAMPSYR